MRDRISGIRGGNPETGILLEAFPQTDSPCGVMEFHTPLSEILTGFTPNKGRFQMWKIVLALELVSVSLPVIIQAIGQRR